MIRFSTIIWLAVAGLVGVFILFFFELDTIDIWNRTIKITDVSHMHAYKIENKFDSTPVNVRLSIEGEIDGNAFIYVSEKKIENLDTVSTNKNCNNISNSFRVIEKGKVDINKMFFDYYQDAPGYIYYVPCGITKGKLKIIWAM